MCNKIEIGKLSYHIFMVYLTLVFVMTILAIGIPISSWSHPIEAMYFLLLWGVGTLIFLLVIRYIWRD